MARLFPPALLAGFLAPLLPGTFRAEDCNGNGVDDLEDIQGVPLMFEAVPATPFVGAVRAATAVDFDGDGLQDLAAATARGNEVVVLLQRGAVYSKAASAGLSASPRAIAVADLERDGDRDLIVALEDPPRIALVRNGGAGPVTLEELDLPSALGALVAADLDGDGDSDLAGAASFEALTFRNDGVGGFTLDDLIPIGSNPVAIAAFDFEGDGDADLATANTLGDSQLPGNISLLVNNGGGVFATPRNLAAAPDPRAIAVLDLNEDGRLDIAAAGTSLEVYRNRGNGDFDDAESLASGVAASSLCVLDAHNDGDPDLAIGSRHQVSIFINEGKGVFHAGPRRLVSAAEPLALAAADLDGDGDDDLAVAGDALILLLLESGEPSSVSFPAGGITTAHVAADMDGDGDADIVTAEMVIPDKGAVRVLANDGMARFAAGPGEPLGDLPYRMVLVDLEPDGDLDVVVTTQHSRVEVLRRDGASLVQATTLEIGGNVTALAAGDLNGDGAADLAVGSEQEGLILFRNAGGTFIRGTSLLFAEMFPYFTVATDLDRDGHLDLASVTGDKHKLVIHWNDGNGGFTRDPPVAAGSYPLHVVPSDLDGDGDLDLAIPNYGGDGARTIRNEGGRRLVPGVVSPAGSPTTIVTADVDHDGDQDVACAGMSSGLNLLLNDGHGELAPGKEIAPVDMNAVWLSGADFDGDGAGDISLGMASFGARITVFLGRSRPAVSRDANGDGIPDECQGTSFRRGDADTSGGLDLSDALSVLRFLFLGDAAPSCLDAADADDSGNLAITDGVFILGFLFLGAPPPPAPGPPPEPCGLDPPGVSLGCAAYPGC